MRKLLIFSVFCMLGVLRGASTTDDEDKNIISRSFFDMSSVKYKANHDIVEILVPLEFRTLNFENSKTPESIIESEERFMKDIVIFFVEADIQNGNRIDQGLYVFKNDQAKKLLPSARTAATTKDKKHVFFGASDGLFAYDGVTNSAVKYGPITDGIISIAVTNEAQYTIYILTDDHKLYKVSSNGETKDLVSDVEDAQEIVLDNNHNIYYYKSNKEVFIRTTDGVIKVRDLPPNPKSLKLIRPPFVMRDAVPLMFDDSLYIVYANGTSQVGNLEFTPDARPTAYATEAVLIQYYAFDKKLYEYNFMQLTAQDKFEDIEDKAENIFFKTTKTKNTLG